MSPVPAAENRLLQQGVRFWWHRAATAAASVAASRHLAGLPPLLCCSGPSRRLSSFTAHPLFLLPLLSPSPPAGAAELKAHLQQRRAAPYWARLADFHLLLYLARQPNFDSPEVGGCASSPPIRAPGSEGNSGAPGAAPAPGRFPAAAQEGGPPACPVHDSFTPLAVPAALLSPLRRFRFWRTQCTTSSRCPRAFSSSSIPWLASSCPCLFVLPLHRQAPLAPLQQPTPAAPNLQRCGSQHSTGCCPELIAVRPWWGSLHCIGCFSCRHVSGRRNVERMQKGVRSLHENREYNEVRSTMR